MPDSAATPRRPSPEWWQDEGLAASRGLMRYHRLWLVSVFATGLVSLIPLVISFAINYTQYRKAFLEETRHPIRLATSNTRRAVAFFLEERVAALSYIIHESSFAELADQRTLARTFSIMRDHYSGFVDVGVIDAKGLQRAYVGPYGLHDKSYRDQPWFNEALLKGVYVTDVFMGYRQFPHFAIAVKADTEDGTPFVLRATINASVFDKMGEFEGHPPWRDAFIINRSGVLQTPSRWHGPILAKVPFAIPPWSADAMVKEERDPDGVRLMGYAYIAKSPFIFVAVEKREALLGSWFSLRNKLLLFLAGSAVLIVIVILAGATYMVRRVREADDKRLGVLHRIEYTAKMASIGRLAAGVAHEINNPLAIINEKAGLLKDYITLSEGFAEKERFLKHVEPILGSVERCARITRRLLGFAKHMDLRLEPINLGALVHEVLGFLEKDSAYRNIAITVTVAEEVPVIESDRGRLQQVFLNVVNNAFGAVEDGGKIDISLAGHGEHFVQVTIRDNGVGISEENLEHIFEPFFTTKEKHGTGLGLSITYGIVSKLGGKITVASKLGEGTEFTVILPIKADGAGASDGRS